MNTDTRQIPDHVLQAAFGQTSLDIWKYDEYRATLRLNDRFFALVTPNGHSTISKEDASKLLAVLNRSSLGQPAAVDWQASLEAGIKRMEAVTVEELAHIYNVSWDAHHSALCKDPLPLEAVRTRLIAAAKGEQP